MTGFSEIKQDYEAMHQDFKLLASTIKLSRGMKTRHSNVHDIDIVVTMHSRKASSVIEAICWKWNDLFAEKYGLTLDVTIQRKTNSNVKHLYDFDYRIGIVDHGYPAIMGEEGEKHLDGKWVALKTPQSENH